MKSAGEGTRRAALVLAGMLLWPGCSLLYPELTAVVEVPATPWETAGVRAGWVLVYPDEAGEVRTRSLPAGLRQTEIRLPRGYGVPVAAYPLGRLKPCGGFAGITGWKGGRPGGLAPGWNGKIGLQLEEEYGPLAEMMLSLWRLSGRCGAVNIEELQRAILEEGGGDPWSCDVVRIRHAILTGTLNYRGIRRSPEIDAEELPLPSSDWIPETSLWKGSIAGRPGTEPGSWLVEFGGLLSGCTRFYSPGTGLELHIYSEKKGGCRYVIGSLSDFSSRF
ncbi:MAG: hypothetical protein ACP5IA_07440 [Sediminispirochaetaceae bacterium]